MGELCPDADMDGQRGRAPCGQGVCQCHQHATLARLHAAGPGRSWKLRPTTTLTARLRNATDRIYAANAGSGQVYLGAPRTLDVTLHTAF